MRSIAATTLFLFTVLSAGLSYASDFNWTQLDYPGAKSTFLYGIDNGNMVGWYRDNSGGDYGFHYDGSSWNQIDHPTGTNTHLHAIQGNKVVGSYLDSAGNRQGAAYNLSTHQWQTYSLNGPPANDIFGLDGDKMVGYTVDFAGVKHGSYYDGTTWTQLDYPQTAGTMNSFFHAINNAHIIGSYIDYGVSPAVEHGIVYDTDTNQWEQLDYPNASQTYLYEIEGANLVGAFNDSSGHHGFHYDSLMDDWQQIDYPEATLTALHGIDGNNLVGFYHDSSGEIHGFLVTGEFGQTQIAPEPTTLLLALVGLAMLPRRRRRGR